MIASSLLVVAATAGCKGDPAGARQCQYGIYPPNGVQMQPNKTRDVESISSCAEGLDIEYLEPLKWTSSDSTVVAVSATSLPRYATLHAHAVGSAIVTVTYAGGHSALLSVEVLPGS